jgi:hypothetical protein
VPEAHALLVQLGQLALQHLVEDEQQALHFLRRAAPVLGREGVDGQVGDAELDAGGDDPAQILDARAVPGQPRQPARQGPAAVAVHDDGDVGGEFFH